MNCQNFVPILMYQSGNCGAPYKAEIQLRGPLSNTFQEGRDGCVQLLGNSQEGGTGKIIFSLLDLVQVREIESAHTGKGLLGPAFLLTQAANPVSEGLLG